MSRGSSCGEHLLNECPFCDYSLEGLPVQHKCPECGREYDRRWRVFGNRPRWHYLGRKRRGFEFVQIVYFAFVWLWIGFFMVGRFSGFWGVSLRLCCLFFLACASVLNGWHLLHTPRRFLIVGSDWVALANRSTFSLTYYESRTIRGACARGSALLLVLERGEQVLILCDYVVPQAEVERCADCVNSLIRERPLN